MSNNNFYESFQVFMNNYNVKEDSKKQEKEYNSFSDLPVELRSIVQKSIDEVYEEIDKDELIKLQNSIFSAFKLAYKDTPAHINDAIEKIGTGSDKSRDEIIMRFITDIELFDEIIMCNLNEMINNLSRYAMDREYPLISPDYMLDRMEQLLTEELKSMRETKDMVSSKIIDISSKISNIDKDDDDAEDEIIGYGLLDLLKLLGAVEPEDEDEE